MALNTFNPGDDLLSSEVNENFQKIVETFFGDGSDGDVTIDSDTTLTKNMNYNNLTIEDGVTLYPKGFKIQCLNKITFNGTGKISSNGGDGENGQNAYQDEYNSWQQAQGGSGGDSPHADGAFLAIPRKGLDGADGKKANDTNVSKDGNNVNGEDVDKAFIEEQGASGGNGGDAGAQAEGGVSSGGKVSYSKNIDNYNIFNWSSLIDQTEGVLSVLFPRAGSSGGGSGAIDSPSNDACGSGAGGGSGAPGGFVYIAAREIEIEEDNTIVEAKGGNGGNGGNGDASWYDGDYAEAGGGGGGAGGDGGIVVLIYSSKTGDGSYDLSGGTGGTGGSGKNDDGEDGDDGNNGSEGQVFEYQW